MERQRTVARVAQARRKVAIRSGILLSFIGLACFGAALGLKALSHQTRGTVMLSPGETVDLEGTTLRLKSFAVPKYPSGKPRQFVSEVQFGSDDANPVRISVNHPYRRDGLWIYQYSYDTVTETATELLIVRDRWLPLAALASILMLLGALWNCWEERKGKAKVGGEGWLRVLYGILVSCVPLFIIGRALLRPEPVPALQSPLLAPHVAAYVASYLIFLFAAFGVGRRLMPLGFLLMTFGLVIGGVWGKVCWGDFWQYDPKEMASLATWLVYLAYFALNRHLRVERALRILGAVFILLTLLVVNFAKVFAGLHSYA